MDPYAILIGAITLVGLVYSFVGNSIKLEDEKF